MAKEVHVERSTARWYCYFKSCGVSGSALDESQAPQRHRMLRRSSLGDCDPQFPTPSLQGDYVDSPNSPLSAAREELLLPLNSHQVYPSSSSRSPLGPPWAVPKIRGQASADASRNPQPPTSSLPLLLHVFTCLDRQRRATPSSVSGLLESRRLNPAFSPVIHSLYIAPSVPRAAGLGRIQLAYRRTIRSDCATRLCTVYEAALDLTSCSSLGTISDLVSSA